MQLQSGSFLRPYYIYLAVFSGNLLSFGMGVTYNWAASIAPKLQSNDSSVNPLPHPTSTLENSLIVSVTTLSASIGPIVGGIIVSKLGKKKTILLLGIPLCLGHLFIAFATEVWMFVVGRFSMGLTVGCVFGVMASYAGDISEDRNRGLIGSIMTIFISMGGLFVYVTGPFISIKLFSLLNLIPLVGLFTSFGFFTPETPNDLLQRNMMEEAKKSLSFFRGKNLNEVNDELKILQNRLNGGDIENQTKTTAMETFKSIFKITSLLKGFKMVFIILVLQQFSGMAAVANYFQTIFDESGGSVDPVVSVIIIGVVTLFATTLTSQLVERLGRKFLLLSSFFLMAISLFSLGSYFLVQSQGRDTQPIGWLPIISLIFFVIAYNLGAGIPWVLMTDMFPTNVKDTCITMLSCLLYTLAFVITLTYPYLQDAVGNYGVFYIFGCLTCCALVYTFFVVPETKGKSIEEVQEMLNK